MIVQPAAKDPVGKMGLRGDLPRGGNEAARRWGVGQLPTMEEPPGPLALLARGSTLVTQHRPLADQSRYPAAIVAGDIAADRVPIRTAGIAASCCASSRGF